MIVSSSTTSQRYMQVTVKTRYNNLTQTHTRCWCARFFYINYLQPLLQRTDKIENFWKHTCKLKLRNEDTWDIAFRPESVIHTVCKCMYRQTCAEEIVHHLSWSWCLVCSVLHRCFRISTYYIVTCKGIHTILFKTNWQKLA